MEVESVNVEEENRRTQQRFEAAVKVIKSLPPNGPFQPSNDIMLKFYSYYKQATIGQCNIARPGFWDVVGKAKWDAWNALGNMPKEEAMAAYVDQMKLILEGMPMTDEVEELLRVLGPFYELVDEKKKITQISDLSTGFGTMLNTAESKSVAKSIIRNMEMNGVLETRPAKLKQGEEQGEEDSDDSEEEDDDDDDQIEDIKEIRNVSPVKKKSSSRRHKSSHPNGKLTNGVNRTPNGNHPRAALNSDDSQDAEPLLNGHHADSRTAHIASDSDSEVYCDSVDQFGQDENSEHNRSLDDLDEEVHVLLPVEELQEEVQDPPQAVRCGGEDGEGSEASSQRRSLNVNMPGGFSRRGRGSRSSGFGAGPQTPGQGSGDGGGERWGGGGNTRASLNEQIVVALSRLQEDMHSVLERLHTLEALTASQARSAALSPTFTSPSGSQRNKKPAWWPFDISPASLAFAVIWPFVVQGLFRLYFQRRKRRIN